jgi:hypothetical protein
MGNMLDYISLLDLLVSYFQKIIVLNCIKSTVGVVLFKVVVD